MKRIALKIDVDTLAGTRIGAPALAQLLDRQQVKGTFFFSLGPDRAGCQKSGESLKRFYPLATRLRGRLLPSADISRRTLDILRRIHSEGHEVALHAHDRVAWEAGIDKATTAWIDAEMSRAEKRFTEIFAEKPAAFAAPGWKSQRHALRLTQRLGYSYASDTRGSHPFIPVIDGEIVACPQLPTTLPTVDEVLALDPALTTAGAYERILKLSLAIPGDHVFTLRAEIEGMRFLTEFEKQIADWKEAGTALVPLRELRADSAVALLPRHVVEWAEIPGRRGLRMTQGPAYPLGE
ncbi:polysaccharide deacetylase family protein [Propionivibrio dicarboxylicus]|uniref:Polysaccharide deacetylase n=1 Tax=Propionivibrio dicarboxylicus TaxID=83767 RepID=A0A1G7XPQ4_9RHOO|nr:polysaccharide deacetylase family protein [Propionivibrio dicarboxylicus]SDG86013.1 Polysaccharide deacetylase [Propionivibrio dicarboxylicus]